MHAGTGKITVRPRTRLHAHSLRIPGIDFHPFRAWFPRLEAPPHPKLFFIAFFIAVFSLVLPLLSLLVKGIGSCRLRWSLALLSESRGGVIFTVYPPSPQPASLSSLLSVYIGLNHIPLPGRPEVLASFPFPLHVHARDRSSHKVSF